MVLLSVTVAFAHAQVQQLPPGTSSSLDDSTTEKPADPSVAALQAAEARMATQDWAGAVALLKPLAEQSPRNARALYDVGFCDESLNDTTGASLAYTRAAEADKEAVLPRVALGLLLARNGDGPAAEVRLTEAVSINNTENDTAPARAQAYRALARLHLAAAPEQSRAELLQAIHLSSEVPADLQLSGEIAEGLGDNDAAEQAYGRLARAQPADADAAAQYARMLLRNGKPDEATALLDAGLKLHPESSSLLTEKAGLLLHEQNIAAAVPLLETLHAAHPGDPAAARLLARAYVAKGDPAKADALFQQLTQADPTNGDLLSEWADGLIRQKRNGEAEGLLNRALLARFSSPQARAKAASELAFAASENHEPQTVLRAISIRNGILPMDATSAFLLATAHDTLHQARDAAGFYRQFLQLADRKFPDEEWQATQRLQVLSRAK